MKTIQFGTRASVLVLLAAMALSLVAVPADAATYTSTENGNTYNSYETKRSDGSMQTSNATTGSTPGGAGQQGGGGAYGIGGNAGGISGSSKSFTGYSGNTENNTVRNTATIAELMVKIQALLAQVQALKVQVGNMGNGNDDDVKGKHEPAVCRAIQNLGNFRRGMSGSGVKTIQQFLTTEGDLAAGNMSGYFGIMTETALKKWQKEHNIVATGTASTTGHGVFGVRTREAMYRACENHDEDAAMTFRVSPSRGEAPLTVEIAGLPSAVLKKINECKYSLGFFGASGNGLTIDWGDGTESPESDSVNRGKSCTNEVKKHTYTKAGTYTVKVRSWHPGPTDAPITDWSGTARVVVIADEDENEEEGEGTKVSNTTPAAIKARMELAKKIDAFTSTITIKEVRKRDWSDGCLGLGGAAESCLAAITPGYRVTLDKASTTYYARTNLTGSVVRFEE